MFLHYKLLPQWLAKKERSIGFEHQTICGLSSKVVSGKWTPVVRLKNRITRINAPGNSSKRSSKMPIPGQFGGLKYRKTSRTLLSNVPSVSKILIIDASLSTPKVPIAADLFVYNGNDYLIVVDYFSRLVKLSTTTAQAVIKALKTIFSRHGVPETVMSDNGPQFS